MTSDAMQSARRRWLLGAAGAATLAAGSGRALAALREVPGTVTPPVDGEVPPWRGDRVDASAGRVQDTVDRELDRWLIEPQSGVAAGYPSDAFASSAPQLDLAPSPSVVRATILSALATYADVQTIHPLAAQVLHAHKALFGARRDPGAGVHIPARIDAPAGAIVRRNNTMPVWVVLEHVRRPADLLKWWALGADVVVVPGDKHRWAADVQELMRHAGVHTPQACRTSGLVLRV